MLDCLGGKWSPIIGLCNGTNHSLDLNVLPERPRVKLRPSGDFRDILGRPWSDLALLDEAAAQIRGVAGL